MSCPIFLFTSAGKEAGGKSEVVPVCMTWAGLLLKAVWHQQNTTAFSWANERRQGRAGLLLNSHPPHKFIQTRYWEFTSVPLYLKHWKSVCWPLAKPTKPLPPCLHFCKHRRAPKTEVKNPARNTSGSWVPHFTTCLSSVLWESSSSSKWVAWGV